MNKHDLAADLKYPYDVALPQWWWDRAYEVTGENPVDYAIVWGYPRGTLYGEPVALDDAAEAFLAKVDDA